MRSLTATLVAAVALATPGASAPVPKALVREGLVLFGPSDLRLAPRLYRPDGTLAYELPFTDVRCGRLSPDGKRLAVAVRNDPSGKPKPPEWAAVCDLYVVPADISDRAKLGEPVARGLHWPLLAWAPDGKSLYASDRDERPDSSSAPRPLGVTVCDLARDTTAVNDDLSGCCVHEVSPDGKHLLVGRYSGGPAPRWGTDLLHRDTLTRVDYGERVIEFTHFMAAGKLLATQGKDHVIFDPKTSTATPVVLPKAVREKAVREKAVRVERVLPSPDGKRLLFAWTEEVPHPPDWMKAQWPCRPTRLTVSDPDGENAKTIFNPQVEEAADLYRSQWLYLDWR